MSFDPAYPCNQLELLPSKKIIIENKIFDKHS